MNCKVQLESILNYIKNDSELKKFCYYKEFLSEWENLFEYYSQSEYVFFQKDLSDYDQAYHYKYKLNDTELVFDFSIRFIRDLYQISNKNNNNNLFPLITLDYRNKRLSYGEADCVFNFYDINECESGYRDIEDVFVMQIPMIPITYIVIDGNHRISSLIHAGSKTITARLCRTEICGRALFTPFSVALYYCLFDCAIIRYNLGKFPEHQLKRQLSVFDKTSFVNNLENR